jgi:RNA polymerase sigma factor (sigma-70 family)
MTGGYNREAAIMAEDEDSDDVTQWMVRLGEGDKEAARRIWRRYFGRLMRLARRRLEGLPRRVADEEDVALSAMKSFYRGMAGGRFPELRDRDDLWRLLVTITARKALDQARRDYAQKRGGARVRGESAFGGSDRSSLAGGIDQVLGEQPTPDLAVMIAESCVSLLECLDDKTLKELALLKMEGLSNDEIAAELGCTTRTVERKLARIRRKWEREVRP